MKACSVLRYKSTLSRVHLVPPELLDCAHAQKVPTHELLPKLGYLHHPKPGLVNWLPMGIAVRRKIEDIIHVNMQQAGAEQVEMALLLALTLWEITGRWNGSELFKLKDSAGADYCLAPTCEEEITALVKNTLSSYKNLPLIYYQVSNKYRDEKRPRSGLLRGREFLMKDAYSFNVDEPLAMAAYDSMVAAYHRIFDALKVPYVKATADTGEIGGSLSHEWHYKHPLGEDTLFSCPLCGHSSNIEKTQSYPTEEQEHKDVSVRYFATLDRNMLVCAYYPSLRQLQPSFLCGEVPDIDLSETLSQDDILNLFKDESTLIGKRIVRVMDSRLNSRSNFPDFPINFINRSLITTLTDIPIVAAEEGEICSECEDGHLEKSRAIEVGHTFHLGDKYSSVLGCQVDVAVNGTTERRNVLMGCYGIGISRLVAAIAEITRDEYGLRWPAAIAPWCVTIVEAGGSGHVQDVAAQLDAAGIDYKVDNRPKLGLGRKIRESKAVGIPLVVVVGKKYPTVDIDGRDINTSVDISLLGATTKSLLSDM